MVVLYNYKYHMNLMKLKVKCVNKIKNGNFLSTYLPMQQ